MTWDSMTQFLAMGGYGLYVWGSVAATAALLGAELLALRARRKAARRRVLRLHRSRQPYANERTS